MIKKYGLLDYFDIVENAGICIFRKTSTWGQVYYELHDPQRFFLADIYSCPGTGSQSYIDHKINWDMSRSESNVIFSDETSLHTTKGLFYSANVSSDQMFKFYIYDGDRREAHTFLIKKDRIFFVSTIRDPVFDWTKKINKKDFLCFGFTPITKAFSEFEENTIGQKK